MMSGKTYSYKYQYNTIQALVLHLLLNSSFFSVIVKRRAAAHVSQNSADAVFYGRLKRDFETLIEEQYFYMAVSHQAVKSVRLTPLDTVPEFEKCLLELRNSCTAEGKDQ